VSDFWYNAAKAGVMDGSIDLDSDDIRVLVLVTDSEDPDHASLADVKASGVEEGTSNGYSRQSLSGKAVSQNDTDDRGELDAANVTFSSVSQTASNVWQALVVYKHVDGTDANDIPIAHIDSGGFPITPNGSNIQVSWAASGILHVT
jgi:hypothetical protein